MAFQRDSFRCSFPLSEIHESGESARARKICDVGILDEFHNVLVCRKVFTWRLG